MNAMVKGYIRKSAVNNFFINLVINGLIAYFLNRSKTMLHLGGEHGFGLDIVITAFALYFLITWILIPVSRMHVRKGHAPKLKWDETSRLHKILSKFPKGAFVNAVIFSILGMLVVVPVTLGILYILGATEMTPAKYAVFKGVWAGTIAGALVFMIVPIGLAHAAATETV
jgi:hypothetical protein